MSGPEALPDGPEFIVTLLVLLPTDSVETELQTLSEITTLYVQGWALDVKARDRDETETRPRRDVCSSRRDRDVEVQVLLITITGLDVIFHVHCF